MRKTFKFYQPVLTPLLMNKKLFSVDRWLGPVYDNGLCPVILHATDAGFESYKRILRQYKVNMYVDHDLESKVIN